jgi:hypothetical protein
MANTGTDGLLSTLKSGVMASTVVADGNVNTVNSISEALSDYYLDSNYGIPGAVLQPRRVHIFIGSRTDAPKWMSNYNYTQKTIEMINGYSDDRLSTVFGSVQNLGGFVQEVVYNTAGTGSGKDTKDYIGVYDITDPEIRRKSLEEIFKRETKMTEDEISRLIFVNHLIAFLRPGFMDSYANWKLTDDKANKSTYEEYLSMSATIMLPVLMPWMAYQYIDYVPIGVVEGPKYDSFIETQLRQLTKVVFVANMLRAAHSAATNDQKPAIVAAFNKVIEIPKKDRAMLADFLDSKSPKYLDTLYKTNVDKSAELYNAATALEEKDAKMRQAQDNLRAINTNDELMTTVRRRAYILYIVVWVLMAALVGALSLAAATRSYGVMYATVAVVCVLVLLTEVTRGVGKILRI